MMGKYFRKITNRIRMLVLGRDYSLRRPRLGSMPYPVRVSRRGVPAATPADVNATVFDVQEAKAFNQARLDHLDTMGLSLSGKRVLDVGCGVGHLARFFLDRECEVVCVDAREENVAAAKELHPGLEAHALDVQAESLSSYGTFDIVLCYGLLYHLENPIGALRNIASVCTETLLLSTQVCDHHLPVMRIEDESSARNQAIQGIGHRPSPSYVVLALNRVGFDHIYAPKQLPDHEDYRFEWKSDLGWRRRGRNLRCIFIASREALQNPQLVELLK